MMKLKLKEAQAQWNFWYEKTLQIEQLRNQQVEKSK